jgi:nucleoside-diphosphate kinase
MPSLIILKPHVLASGQVGKILSRFERKGIRIEHLKTMNSVPAIIEAHYAEHIGKEFYPKLLRMFENQQVIVFVATSTHLSNEVLISTIRALVGSVNIPGTIRGDFGLDITQNAIHASDSVEAARREIDLWCPYHWRM